MSVEAIIGVTFLAIAINALIGAAVCVAIDDEQQSLYKWYERCPIPYTGHFLVLSLWPIILYFWLRK